ncbi:5355_t:CDS:2, partial [Paraglomus brasilianum]
PRSNDDSTDGIDPDNLTLWRVFIPVENDAILQKLVLENANGVQKLYPTEEVSDVFSETPPKKHIHIIVEPPARPTIPMYEYSKSYPSRRKSIPEGGTIDDVKRQKLDKNYQETVQADLEASGPLRAAKPAKFAKEQGKKLNNS